jgi:hypothetical protein
VPLGWGGVGWGGGQEGVAGGSLLLYALYKVPQGGQVEKKFVRSK